MVEQREVVRYELPRTKIYEVSGEQLDVIETEARRSVKEGGLSALWLSAAIASIGALASGVPNPAKTLFVALLLASVILFSSSFPEWRNSKSHLAEELEKIRSRKPAEPQDADAP
ncbi:MAG: hypothetical protein F4Z32_00515 [Gemmatimonadetes bacterium]|nr:hypothetical protein [Gemmatimonadota bacterium]